MKKATGFVVALFVISLPVTGVMGIRYASGVYGIKRSAIIENCKVMAVVETPREILLAVSIPQSSADNPVPELNLRIVRAYGRWDKDKQSISEGDIVICGFPERDTMRKGYVVKNS